MKHGRFFDTGVVWALAASVGVGLSGVAGPGELAAPDISGVRVGTGAVVLEADDSMVIAGGIGPGKATGQEGQLRAAAVVLEKEPFGRLAIVACDVLMITRQYLDSAAAEIERTTGIPAGRVLVSCTHTHHAPSTVQVHAYGTDETFARRVEKGVVQAVQKAAKSLEECRFSYHLAHETTVGQNSRQLLRDGTIYWVGPRDQFVRPTGPFDPELPVLVFRNDQHQLRALLFNHSTHAIGTHRPGVRSPSFYGLAAQAIEAEHGGLVCFLAGACGSTHNLDLSGVEMSRRMKEAVLGGMAGAKEQAVHRLAALKRPFRFKVRHFDETAEDAAVTAYCRKWLGTHAEEVVRVFRQMRRNLAGHQGETRETWIQAMLIGDVALVGVPAEYFTKLGLDIKNRSPFRDIGVIELANDWIGYLPDLDAHKLGGYQVWTGYHSYAEPGTGERMVDEVVCMLSELASTARGDSGR